MSSHRRSRRALLSGAAGLVTLAACGFTPVYGPGGAAAPLRNAVRTTEPDTDIAFAFVRRFEERLGPPSETRFDLAYTISTDEEGLAIDRSNNITRYNIEGRLDWTLSRVGEEGSLRSGQESAFTAYSASGSTISTLESERDARRRLAGILADKLVTRLLAEAPDLAR